MKFRCVSTNAAHYKYYCGKGIRVCDLWLNDFESFYRWSVENGYQDGLTIDRKNSNRGYSPANCRWTDGFSQALTNGKNRKLLWQGRLYSTGELAKKFGIKRDTLNNRLCDGWGLKKALAVPEKLQRVFLVDGERLTIPEIAEKYGIKYFTLIARIDKYGWTVDDAVKKAVRCGGYMRKYPKRLEGYQV